MCLGAERCRAAWEKWLAAGGALVDFARPDRDFRRPGLHLCVVGRARDKVADDSIRLIGCDGKRRWEMRTPAGVSEVRWLVGDRLPVAERGTGRVTERDLAGRAYWQAEAELGSLAYGDVWRLPDGTTLLTGDQQVIGFDLDGKRAFQRHDFPDPGRSWGPAAACPLSNGRVAVLASLRENESYLLEADPRSGEVTRRVRIRAAFSPRGGATRLPPWPADTSSRVWACSGRSLRWTGPARSSGGAPDLGRGRPDSGTATPY